MKRVLVTGGSGFVGANLVRRLLADGHQTHLLLRAEHAPWRLEGLDADVRRHDGDVSDPDAVSRAFESARPEWVFHLAAHGAYPFQTDLQQMIATNVSGATHVIEGALSSGTEAVILAGSSSEYGLKDHAPTETESIEPDSDYAVTKAAATLYAAKEARRTGANITSLRLYSVYGPWEAPARFMPTLAIDGLEGRFPRLASPRVARDFVYVDDVVEAFVLAARRPTTSPGAVYNIGSGVQRTLEDVVALARERLGIPGAPVWGSMEDRSWDTTTWVSDCRRARQDLGWAPRQDLASGFDALVAWLSSNDSIRERYRRDIAR